MKLPIALVIDLLHRAPHVTLATQSAQLSGYPYATVIPNVLDRHHQPLLLVSALAEHTKNLQADPKVSLSVLDPAAPDAQTGARLSLIGDAERFTPDAATQARYLRYLPAAEAYLGLDFMFFRIVPRRLRFIAGVGQMGWFEHAEWATLPALSGEDEAAVLQRLEPVRPPSVEWLGADGFGIDYLQDGQRARFAFPEPVTSPERIVALADGRFTR